MSAFTSMDDVDESKSEDIETRVFDAETLEAIRSKTKSSSNDRENNGNKEETHQIGQYL